MQNNFKFLCKKKNLERVWTQIIGRCNNLNKLKIYYIKVVTEFKVKIGFFTIQSSQPKIVQTQIKIQQKPSQQSQKAITIKKQKEKIYLEKLEPNKPIQSLKPKFGQRMVPIPQKKQQIKVEKIVQDKKKIEINSPVKKPQLKIVQQKGIASQKKLNQKQIQRIVIEKPTQKVVEKQILPQSNDKITQKVISIQKTNEKLQVESNLPQIINQKLNKKQISKPVSNIIIPNQQIILQKKSSVEPKQITKINQPVIRVDLTVNYSQQDPKGQVYWRTINCLKIQPSNIYNKQISIQIKNFETVQGGIFQQSYVIYKIETLPQKWLVSRRYTDFVWLKQQLQRMHPGVQVPPLPKKGNFRKFDEQHLFRRMVTLQNFLNKIINNPQLKCEKIVENFLKIVETVQYVKSKKQEISQSRIPLQKLKNLSGKVQLKIDPQIQSVINFAKENLNICQPQILKLYKQSRTISEQLYNASNSLKEISSIFGFLTNQTQRINKCFNIDQKYESSFLFSLMQNSTLSLSKLIHEQAQFIKKYLYGVYKYEYISQTTILQSIKKVQQSKQQYYAYKTKLKKIKQKLYDQKNPSRWGLSTVNAQKMKKQGVDKKQAMAMMLPKQTENQLQLKEYYGLLNYQCYQSLNRHYIKNAQHLGDTIENLGKKYSKNSSNGLMIWADLVTKITTFQQGRNIEYESVNEKKKN